MSVDPAFAATPRHEAALLSTSADTSRTAPSNAVTVLTAASSGTKVEEVVFEGTGTTVAGIVCLFIYDGANYNLFDEQVITVVTASTTAAAGRWVRLYDNLVLRSGESLRASSQVANQPIKVHAFGGDL